MSAFFGRVFRLGDFTSAAPNPVVNSKPCALQSPARTNKTHTHFHTSSAQLVKFHAKFTLGSAQSARCHSVAGSPLSQYGSRGQACLPDSPSRRALSLSPPSALAIALAPPPLSSNNATSHHIIVSLVVRIASFRGGVQPRHTVAASRDRPMDSTCPKPHSCRPEPPNPAPPPSPFWTLVRAARPLAAHMPVGAAPTPAGLLTRPKGSSREAGRLTCPRSCRPPQRRAGAGGPSSPRTCPSSRGRWPRGTW